MGITRRNFIQFLAGGAVGLQLTPLPWKLTDDIAIWTQNWSWVPVPPTGRFSTTKSVCTLCSGGCGIEVRKVDGRAVKIEGRTDFPVNPGGVCPLGMGGLQLLYNRDYRFQGPMKRAGYRGSGDFVPITWEEALTTLADRLTGLRKTGRPQTLAAVDGNPVETTTSLLVERLLKAVGSPNYLRVPTAEDTERTAASLMEGTEGPMGYDLENADFILSFGAGLIEGWGSPGRVINAWRLWHERPEGKRTRVVQVEPRASTTASKADQWVAARPGTEAALALGLAHVMIQEGLYDRSFVDRYTFGFTDWQSEDGKTHRGFRSMVQDEYPPDRVSEITGVPRKKIVALARDFAQARAPLAVSGKGKGTLPGSLYEVMAVHVLNALLGNLQRSGGAMVQEPLPLSPLPDVKMDPVARKGLKQEPLDRAGGVENPFAGSLINNFSRAVLEGPQAAVDTLLVFGANPAFTLPDAGSFRKSLEKIPFIVSFSPYRDETAYMADLILPDHSYLEKREDLVQPGGLQYPLYAVSKPAVEPVYNTRNTGDVVISLAKRIGAGVGASFPWKDHEAVMQARAKGLYEAGGLTTFDPDRPPWESTAAKPESGFASFDEMWQQIREGGFWYRPSPDRSGTFGTPSGKFEFYSRKIPAALRELETRHSRQKALEALGVAEDGDVVPMPHYQAGAATPDERYPLVMVPYELLNLAGGWVPSPPFLRKNLYVTQLSGDESYADIHPNTAWQYRLRQGDRVVVRSPRGEIRVRVNLFEGAMPGFVFLPLGFGHSAYDEFLKGKGANPNTIVRDRKDPLSGQPVWWETPVQLVKA